MKAGFLFRLTFTQNVLKFKNPKIPQLFQLYKSFHSNISFGKPIKGVKTKLTPGIEISKKLIQHVWPKGNWKVKRNVIIALILLISAKLINAGVPFFFANIIDFYNEKTPENLNLKLNSPTTTIFTTGLALIIAFGLARVGSSLFNELRNAIFAYVAQRSIRQIAYNIFLHLHSLDLSFHLSRQTGALSKAIDRGTRGISFTLNALVFNILPTFFEFLLVSSIFYLRFGPAFTCVTIGCLGMYGIATIRITRWRTKFRHEMNEADNNASNRAIDSLINYETVKYFNNEQLEANRYNFFLKNYEIASLKTTSSLALLNFVQNGIFSTGLIAIIYLATQGVQTGSMTVGDIVLANTLFMQISIPLNFLGSVYREIRQGLQDMQTMFALFDLKSKIVENFKAKEFVSTIENSTISFQNVIFGYIPNQPPILKNLSFEVPAGKKVAIVGGSGCGKSTIIRLLYRLYDPQSGSIFLGNQNISNITLNSLRKSIAVVPQDTVLFHDTLFYNIHYGRPDANENEIYNVAKTADLHDSVMRMPANYNTIVGERGLKLSGGEKQRVAIARAILKNTNIIIYDEATSSLDAISEENIMKSLRKVCTGKTSLFIAHRLATIIDADIIYVLNNGSIIESGTHNQLIENSNSLYAELWSSQNKYGVNIRTKKNKLIKEELTFDNKCCGNSTCNR